MRRWLAVLGCAIAIGGCQTPTSEPTDPGDHTVVVHHGDAAVSVVGTPFYLVFKSVLCAASVAIAAPVAGIAALSDSRFAPEIRRDLGDGVNQNCGPPYVLSPYRVVPTEPAPEISKGPETLQGPPLAAAPEQPLLPAPEDLPAPAAGGLIELFPGRRP